MISSSACLQSDRTDYLDIAIHRPIVPRDGNQIINARDRCVIFTSHGYEDGLS